MGADIFRFKRFEIIQRSSVMKVGTDGVLLGAVVKCINERKILDVGTGTGLIALMIAQKSEAEIDCIDINPEAVELAKQNIANSPWESRLHVFHSSLQDFLSLYKYDLIVSNPPYFSTDITAPDKNRALARHTIELSLYELVSNSKRLLDSNGKLIIIYPYEQSLIFEELASKEGLFLLSRINILSKKDSQPVRSIISFSKIKPEQVKKSVIVIENDVRHDYTDQYKEITKDYYLKF